MQVASASLQYAYQYDYGNKTASLYGQTALVATGDSADISDLARELADRIKELDVFKIIFQDGDVRKRTKTLAEVEDDFNQDFDKFKDLFSLLTGSLNLDPGQAFVMGLDGKGAVKVFNSDGAQAKQIEKVFADSDVAVSRFAVMAARAALVDAGKTDPEFKVDYEADPVAAIKKHIDGLKDRLLGFRVTAAGGELTYDFDL